VSFVAVTVTGFALPPELALMVPAVLTMACTRSPAPS